MLSSTGLLITHTASNSKENLCAKTDLRNLKIIKFNSNYRLTPSGGQFARYRWVNFTGINRHVGTIISS